MPVLFLLLFTPFANALPVYGVDDRIEVAALPPGERELARSVAVLVPKNALSANAIGNLNLQAPTLKMSLFVSESERFSNQPALGECTGFLISDRILMTAGHCIKDMVNGICDEYAWLFDYAYESIDKVDQRLRTPARNLVGCKAILKKPKDLVQDLDFALIELTESVPDRIPLRLSALKPTVGDPLMVIGSPSGLPLKAAKNARVEMSEPEFFKSALDVTAGNSGSPIFNERTLEVVGILVRGERDYESAGGSMRIRTLPAATPGGSVGVPLSHPDIRSSLKVLE